MADSGNSTSSVDQGSSLSDLQSAFAAQEAFEVSLAYMNTNHQVKMAAASTLLTSAQGVRGA